MVRTIQFLLIILASTLVYRAGQYSRPDAQVIRHAELLLRNLTIGQAQKVASRNGIRWTDQEFVKMAVWAEVHDVPPLMLQRVRKFENGGLVYPYGQHQKRDSVRATTHPMEQGMHQGAITLRTALFHFMVVNPRRNSLFLKRHGKGEGTQEQYFRDNQDAIVDYLMFYDLAPRANKASYARFLKSKRW